MASGLVYAPSGGGKTVNATLVKAEKRGKNLLLCSDNSSIVLRNFDRVGLTIETVTHWLDKAKDNTPQVAFYQQFDEAVESKQYDNIIVDNLSDLFDLAILELKESGRYNDNRQAYQYVYEGIKRLVRKAGQLDCNVILTAWAEQQQIALPTGEQAIRITPKLPLKILDNVCGLVNVVAYINTAKKQDGTTGWYYILEGSPTLYAKDQIACRKSCMPEDIFAPKKEEAV
ncbi:ATP-binding protein [Intestinibacillus massiliensis]|nr:ATP-binding protein [Intestinibacillus massiliensis]